MAIRHVHAIALRAHLHFSVADRAAADAAENLQSFAFNLLFLAANVRQHIVIDIQRGHARITGARDRLHRRSDARFDAEARVQRRQGHRNHNRGAIRIRDDESAIITAGRALRVDQREVFVVHFGNQQRHIPIHAM